MILLLGFFPVFSGCGEDGGPDAGNIDRGRTDGSGGGYSVTLSWEPPTTYADGSPVEPAGYKIYYGTSPRNYTEVIEIADSNVTTYVIANLLPTTYYFTVTAYDKNQQESYYSIEVSQDF